MKDFHGVELSSTNAGPVESSNTDFSLISGNRFGDPNGPWGGGDGVEVSGLASEEGVEQIVKPLFSAGLLTPMSDEALGRI